MNFITLKELKKMVPVASEFKRVPGLKKIIEGRILLHWLTNTK